MNLKDTPRLVNRYLSDTTFPFEEIKQKKAVVWICVIIIINLLIISGLIFYNFRIDKSSKQIPEMAEITDIKPIENKTSLALANASKIGRPDTENRKHPLPVKTLNREIAVIGINISSYEDDDKTKTTVLKGSVNVKPLNGIRNQKGLLLKSGQQYTYTNSSISIKNINAEKAIAWKNGQFMFRNEPIFEVMKEISRWYDVEVSYIGDLAGIKLDGTTSKLTNISEVLKILELNGKVHFKMEGRKITVTRQYL